MRRCLLRLALLGLLGFAGCAVQPPATPATPSAATAVDTPATAAAEPAPAEAPPVVDSASDGPAETAPSDTAAPLGAAQRLQTIIDLLAAGQGDAALQSLENLRQDHPDFRLAQRLEDQLKKTLAAGVRVGSLKLLADEARLRLASEQAVPSAGLVPDGVLELDPGIRRVVVVDLANAHLYLLENSEQGLKLVRNHYAAMGSNGWGKQLAGDRRTPLGVYRPLKWLNGATLPPLYGAGAFTLDYPNAWDRLRQRGGGGIWLHGVPRGLDSRAPRSSEGCVTMANADLLALKPMIEPGRTPVLLSDHVQWIAPEALLANRSAFEQRLEAWRQAWANIDTDAYLAFYDDEFSTADMDRAAFVAYKQRVNAQKQTITVTIDGLSVFRYPGEDTPMLLAEFTQHYRSDNFSSDTRKQQFWRQAADGSWKILREETQ